MPTLVSSKYSLKTLHEEIGLLDRKLAHLRKYSVFANDNERVAAATKIENKRGLLVRQALAMVSEGIQFQPSDVPLSLRDGEAVENVPAAPIAEVQEISAGAIKPSTMKPATPFSGTMLDGEHVLQQYKQKKAKRAAPLSAVSAVAESAAAS